MCQIHGVVANDWKNLMNNIKPKYIKVIKPVAKIKKKGNKTNAGKTLKLSYLMTRTIKRVLPHMFLLWEGTSNGASRKEGLPGHTKLPTADIAIQISPTPFPKMVRGKRACLYRMKKYRVFT